MHAKQKQIKKELLYHLEDRLNGLGIKNASASTEAIRKADLNIDKPATWSDEDFYRFRRQLEKNIKADVIVANKIDLPTANANVRDA